MSHHLIRALTLAAVVAVSGGAALAQSPVAPEGTAPPKAPTYPTPPKPDFTPLKFQLGTWTCVSRSERRGNEASTTISTTTMSPDGYFLKTVSKSPKVSYAAVGYESTDWVTYDSNAKRWIDVQVGSYGGYGYSTSTGPSHGRWLWSADSFLPDGDTTSTTGTIITKVSDTKYTTASAFTTAAGLVNKVMGTCTKH